MRTDKLAFNASLSVRLTGSLHDFLISRALRLRPFALLWSGQTISRLGDRFYQVALAWWVLEKTGSAVVMGTVLICSDVPMLVFALLGGALVDRWPRLPVMMLSDLLRGLAVGVWRLCLSPIYYRSGISISSA